MRRLLLFVIPMLLAASDIDDARNAIIAAYNRTFDALNRGDADAALAMDTDDWTSHVVGQQPRSKHDLAPLIRRDIASMKTPPDWVAQWKPDYEHNGTSSGIQVYDVKLDGNSATVLCLVGNTRTEIIDGKPHRVWTGSHVLDSWIKTAAGWKRSKHEKLTINERMIDDGRPVKP